MNSFAIFCILTRRSNLLSLDAKTVSTSELGFYLNDRDSKILSNAEQFGIYEQKCNRLLQEKDIRFAGIVDESGNLVSGGFKKDLTPLEGDESRLKSFMEFVSRVSIPKEYDSSLGPINYLAARRDKVVLISFPFPVSKILLLISAEPTVDIEILSKRIVEIFSGID